MTRSWTGSTVGSRSSRLALMIKTSTGRPISIKITRQSASPKIMARAGEAGRLHAPGCRNSRSGTGTYIAKACPSMELSGVRVTSRFPLPIQLTGLQRESTRDRESEGERGGGEGRGGEEDGS